MANILVTGGAGFLGSHIADALTESGHDVTLLDILPSKWISASQSQITGDINAPGILEQAIEGKDYVYHLAALADLNAARTRPAETVAINIQGTVNLLEKAVDAGVKRVLFGSTVYVYSRQGGFYRCSKQACETYIEEFSEQFGLSYTILRYGSLYGPRADETNGVYRLLKQFMTNDELNYSGTRDDKREYIHVQDAARMSADALGEEYGNRHLVLTGHDRLSIQELFGMFGEILQREIPINYAGDMSAKPRGHYSLTPYNYTPKPGKKLVADEYIDMGQGLLQIIDQIYHASGTNE